jgi:ATP-dependent DNA helicase RecG
VELLSVDELFSKVEDLLAANVLIERRRVERKPAGIQARDLADYISMYANVPLDGGLILVGVENDGTITGCSGLHPNVRNELESAGANMLGVRCDVKSVPVTLANGAADFILAFRVWYCETRAVENSRGDVWLRFGESRKKLSAEEKRELQIAKGQVDYEKEPTPLSFPDDFDVDLLRQFTEKYRRAHAINPSVADKDILVAMRLGKLRTDGSGIFVPNLACAMLFASDPRSLVPGCFVRFLRFEGEEGSGATFNPVRDRTIEGPLPRLIVRTAEEIETQIRNFTGLGKDNKFYSQPEYPREAWYEAVVNACVHRSYNLKNMNIFVKMFLDRVVIESPGAFPPPVTPESIYDMHLPRNPALMDAMKYLDFVQCAHDLGGHPKPANDGHLKTGQR